MITQTFPFLLPLRVAQRKFFFYAGMRLDGHTYAKTMQDALLPCEVFSADSGLYNAHTGFDMVYQENKAFNLKLAAKTLHGLLIRPGETFSFWQAARHADRHTPYKDGLVVKYGRLCTANGGGLCQMTNLLYWLFLHSPLDIVERHTHRSLDFPTMRGAAPEGVDATVSEGWLDLKAKNGTDATFQIGIGFDGESITGSLFADRAMPRAYEIEGRDLRYVRKNSVVYQTVSIFRREIDRDTREALSESLLYTNANAIGYPLPGGSFVEEKGYPLLADRNAPLVWHNQ